MTNEEAVALLRSQMTTREEAIEKLEDAGLIASLRTWSMGETIAIRSRVGETKSANGVASFPIGGYLFPIHDKPGEWGLMDGLNYAPVARFDALVLAVRGAIIWFTGLETICIGKARRGCL